MESVPTAVEVWSPNHWTTREFLTLHFLKLKVGTSLMAQWLRIHLPMQGTRIRALVWEDPTYSRATKPMHHNY